MTTDPAPLRIIIADDHPVYRDGLAQLLGQRADIDVVAVAANGHDAVALTASLQPDVVVMDVRMPDLNGIEATRLITATGAATRVVALSMSDDDDLVLATIRAGARGYLLKDADENAISAALRGIARGEAIFGPGTATAILDRLNTSTTTTRADHPFPQLTTRERDVLAHLSQGRSNPEIARKLYLSERTVRNYVSSIFTKLDVTTRAQAIAAARDAGVTHPLDEER